MSSFATDAYQGKKVLLTGGSGFLGRSICQKLRALGADVHAPRREEFDLEKEEQALQCFEGFRPDLAIHSAAYYGGLQITLEEPGTIFYKNLLMGAHCMEAARKTGVTKYVSIGSACSYPGNLEGAMSETDLWSGPLHDSVAAYGTVKKVATIQGEAYRKQFGFQSIHLMPTNLYGPYDSFDAYRSHAVGALIRKFCEAHRNKCSVDVWGSGSPIREFLFVDDCAEAIVRATAIYDEPPPLNIGTGIPTSIRQLVETIKDVLQFEGEIRWDPSKPEGQARKYFDVSRMKEALSWEPPTSLRDGIETTVRWYQQHL